MSIPGQDEITILAAVWLTDASDRMSDPKKMVCVIPVYNDWDNLELLLPAIAAATREFSTTVLAVDDGSHSRHTPAVPEGIHMEVLYLRNNAGHQRAIAVGLQHAASEHPDAGYVIVMDADGEDRAQDIGSLIAKCAEGGDSRVVFAQRKKRQASILLPCTIT